MKKVSQCNPIRFSKKLNGKLASDKAEELRAFGFFFFFASIFSFSYTRKRKKRKRFVAGTLVTVVKREYREKILSSNSSIVPNAKYEEKVAIETIQVGDVVLSWNEKEKKNEYKRVLNTFVRETKTIFTLTYEDGTQLQTTWNHPFYIKDKGFVEAKSLVVGDLSVTANGDNLKLVGIDTEDRIETVYNFEVEDDHTYFVGDDAVLVHNDGKCEGLFGATFGRYTHLKENGQKKQAEAIGEKQGYLAEIESKMKSGIATAEEIKSYSAVTKKLDIISNAEAKLKRGETLNPTELATYKTNLQAYRDVEKNHSEQIVQKWMREGKTGEAPLTPYAKLILKEQHPDVDLEKVKLVNSGFVKDTIKKILVATGNKGTQAVTILNNVYNMNNGTKYLPGGFDQNNIAGKNDIKTLSHELTHTPQQIKAGLIPFALRYYPELWFNKNNYGVLPFIFNGTKLTQLPKSVNKKESDLFYQGNPTTYDNWAELNDVITSERIKLNILP